MPISRYDRREAGCRKALWFLLSGVGLLGGCQTRYGYKPTLPESCVWVKFPYTWVCVDPEEGRPVPEQETKLWDPVPLASISRQHQFAFENPIRWEDLASTSQCSWGPILLGPVDPTDDPDASAQ